MITFYRTQVLLSGEIHFSEWGAYLLSLEKVIEFARWKSKGEPVVSLLGGFHFLVPEKSLVWFMHIPQEEKPVVKATFGLSLFKMANYYCSNKFVSFESN